MRHVTTIRCDLEEDRSIHPSAQVDRHPNGVGHDHEIREHPNAAQKHVSLASDHFDRTE